ncbi:MAG: hypothetical protein Q7S40_08265 [Opitutaceae bacterium]|nr:hypothetical protein [Opitutaceae bacterium]
MSAAAKSLTASRICLVMGFGCLLIAPVLGGWIRIRPPADLQEMRTPADWPVWASTPTGEWPAKFEAWLNDHFGLRGYLLRAHSIVRHRWLGAPSAGVIVGRNGWLFYAGDRTGEDLVGRDSFTAEELGRWQAALETRRAWLRARGISYLFVIVPNKSSIYPEHLPALLRANLRPGKSDELLHHLAATKCDVPILDLRGTLRDLKRERQVYWQADSHWSGHGLVGACDAIMAKLASLGVPTDRRDIAPLLSFTAADRPQDGIELLAMRHHWPSQPAIELRITAPSDLRTIPSPLLQSAPWNEAPGWKQPVTTECESGVGRAVLFCDSFFRAGGVPLSELARVPLMLRFQRLTSLWEWPDHAMLRQVIDAERPNIVIEARTERFLKIIPSAEDGFAPVTDN